MIYSVTLKAFGHVRSWNYEAESEAEAIEKAKAHAGLEITCKPQPTLDHTHTGGTLR